MKNSLLCFVLAFSIFTVNGQDLIVLENGDSINCQITKEQGDFLHFTFEDGEKTRRSKISKSSTSHYEQGFFTDAEEDQTVPDRGYRKWRIGMHGGFGNRLGEVVESLPQYTRDYLKGLKTGMVIGADYSFYLSRSVGIGLNYRLFSTKIERTGAQVVLAGQSHTGKRQDYNKIHYFAPSFNLRMSSDDGKIHTYGNLGIGYFSYYGLLQINDQEAKYEGEAIGVSAELQLDFMLSSNIALGIQGAILNGAIGMFEVYNGEEWETVWLDEQKEGLGRFDLTIGIKYYPNN